MHARRGFTVIELLIVIVVIAILAVITVVAYNGTQERAKTTQIVSGIRQTEKSLRLYLTHIDANAWPLDDAIDPPRINPSIAQLITDTDYKLFMQSSPDGGTPGVAWSYDNDGDVKPPTGSNYNGTNLILTGISDAQAIAVDAAMDDGVHNTGKIRRDSANLRLFYSLSFSSSL